MLTTSQGGRASQRWHWESWEWSGFQMGDLLSVCQAPVQRSSLCPTCWNYNWQHEMKIHRHLCPPSVLTLYCPFWTTSHEEHYLSSLVCHRKPIRFAQQLWAGMQGACLTECFCRAFATDWGQFPWHTRESCWDMAGKSPARSYNVACLQAHWFLCWNQKEWEKQLGSDKTLGQREITWDMWKDRDYTPEGSQLADISLPHAICFHHTSRDWGIWSALAWKRGGWDMTSLVFINM